MIDQRTLKGFCLGAAFALVSAFALHAGLAGAQTGGNQPHMQSALNALATAREELQVAVANKGGHRVKALEFVNAAIGEVRGGMAAAD
jgi:hypothetical protein